MNNDNEVTELKKEINNLIWSNAPTTLSLSKCEDIAIDIYGMIINGVDITGLQALRIRTINKCEDGWSTLNRKE